MFSNHFTTNFTKSSEKSENGSICGKDMDKTSWLIFWATLYAVSEIGYWGHKFDLSGSHDVIDHDSIPHRPISIGGPWNQASISDGFRDIQW